MGVTRQAIQKKLTPDFRQKYVTKVAGRLQVSNAGVMVLLNGTGSQKQSDFDNQLVTELSHQLQVKDTEISRLQGTIEKLTATLDQQQRLSLLDKQQSQQTIESATKGQLPQKHWWQFWKY